MQATEREGETEKVGNGKICEQCGQFRDRGQFRKHHKSKDGLQSVCIICKPFKAPQSANQTVVFKKPSTSSDKIKNNPSKIFISIQAGSSSVKFECEFQDTIQITMERI